MQVNDYEENYGNGWISIYRSLKKHWIWKDPVKFQWWIDILLEVNHSKQTINIGYDLFDCDRGQSIKSLKNWADNWNVSKDTVRNFFTLLKKDNMIKSENLKKTTRITVCNYDTYQTYLHDKQTQSKRKPNAKQTQDDPNNNVNNENNDNNVNKKEFDFKNLKKETWLLWSEYKKTQFKFSYKSKVSEQVAIDQLIKLSNDNDSLANKIINNSISQGYKGLFELKTNGIEQTSPKLKLL